MGWVGPGCGARPLTRRRHRARDARPRSITGAAFGRDVVGVREYQGPVGRGDRRGRKGRRTVVGHQRQTVSSPTLPVAAVAAGLRQFDVRLDAIDIVSVQSDTSARPSIRPPREPWTIAP